MDSGGGSGGLGSGGLGSLGALSGGTSAGMGLGSPCSSSSSVDGGQVFLSPMSLEVREAIESVKYIAENMRLQNEAKEVSASFYVLSYRTGGDIVYKVVCIENVMEPFSGSR